MEDQKENADKDSRRKHLLEQGAGVPIRAF
jgi:hypothetical protein